MASNKIEGENIYLREMELRDVSELYLKWMKDKQVIKYLESRFTEYDMEKLKSYVSQIKEDKFNLLFTINLKFNDKHIGNIKLGPINTHHKFAEIGIMIGEELGWGKGYGTEAIKLITKYGFEELKLHKLIAGTYSNNIGSIKAFIKAGFTIEGRLIRKFQSKGDYVDQVLLGILNEI